MRIRREIARFIYDELLDGPVDGDPLADDLLDSLGMEQLIEFLEDRFGVSFADDELTAERLGSLRAAEALVRQKLRART